MLTLQQNYIRQVSKEGNVKSHFKKHQEIYSSDINMAIYMDLEDIQKIHVFDIITVNQKLDFVVNFYGFRMHLNDDLSEKLYKLFIRQMDQMLRVQTGRKYYVLLFNESSENKNNFNLLKQMYKRLPAIYFAKLKKIYDIQPGFLTKSFGFINFTAWSRLFYRYVEYVENVEDIQKMAQLKIYNILCKCPKEITRDVKLVCQNTKMVKSAILGSKKEKPFDCLKIELRDYTMDQSRGVPLLLSVLVQTMKQNGDCCLKQGIFRSAGSIEDQQEILKLAFSFKTFRLLDSDQHCKRAISGVIKKIFTESLTPLIPYKVYNQILNQKIDENIVVEYWHQILFKLPPLNRNILCYITKFLRQYILANKDQNKMNAHNLSVVFTPCFFRSKQCSLSDLINSGKFAALFKAWIQKYEQIVGEQTQIKQLSFLNTQIQPNNKSNQQYRNSHTLPESHSLQRQRKNVQKINYEGGLQTYNMDKEGQY